MTDHHTAPERIWVYPIEGTWAYGGMEFSQSDEPCRTEYLRADVAQAMVAAAYEAAADVLRQRDIAPDKTEAYDRGWSRALETAAPAIRALTPDDAAAALEAAKAEAYRAGMLRAAELCLSQKPTWVGSRDAGQNERDDIKSDAIDDCVAAIRAEAEVETKKAPGDEAEGQ